MTTPHTGAPAAAPRNGAPSTTPHIGAASTRPHRPLVMGILNVTPDSFSDGGRYLDLEAALAHGRAMAAEGADVVDVGGESSRPGAEPVPEAEELARVVPVIGALAADPAFSRVRISVDTRKAAVARRAVAAGATLVNDISAGLWAVAAEAGAGWVAMHMQGTPATMQAAPSYGDVVAEVGGFLAERAAEANAAGVAEVWIDPGIGFGKTLAHNCTLLAHLDDLAGLGYPLLVGTSRKGFLGVLASGNAADPLPIGERGPASVASATWAMCHGATMVRVHDVGPAVQAARLVEAVNACTERQEEGSR